MSTFSLTGIKNQSEVSFSSNENTAATPSLGSVRFLWMSLNMRFYFKWITLNAKKKNPGPASSDAYFWVMIPDQKRDLKKMSFWGFIFAKKFLVTELSFYMKRTSLSLDRTSVKQSSFIKMTFFCRVSQNDFFFLSCLLAGRMLGAQIVFSIVSVATINVRSVFHYMQHIYNPRLTHSSFSRSLFLGILNNYKRNFVDNMWGLFFF